MRKELLIICFVLIGSLTIKAQDLQRFKAPNGKFGFKDSLGYEVIAAIYDAASTTFPDGLASVKFNNKWGFIDKTGKVVIEIKFGLAGNFSEGLANVSLNNKWGFIDTKGNEIIPFVYSSAFRFFEGMAAVELNYKRGFIDKTGKIVIPLKYESAYNFSEGLAAVKLNNKYGYIDKTDKEVISFRYDFASEFSEELAIVKLNNKWGFIDKSGEEIIPLIYDNVNIFEKGKAKVKLANREYYIDKTGKEVKQESIIPHDKPVFPIKPCTIDFYNKIANSVRNNDINTLINDIKSIMGVSGFKERKISAYNSSFNPKFDEDGIWYSSFEKDERGLNIQMTKYESGAIKFDMFLNEKEIKQTYNALNQSESAKTGWKFLGYKNNDTIYENNGVLISIPSKVGNEMGDFFYVEGTIIIYKKPAK